MLLGASCGGVTYTLKEHFASFIGWDGGRLERRLKDVQIDRQDALQQIERLTDTNSISNQQIRGLLAPRADEPRELSEFQVIDRIRRRIADLDELERNDKSVTSRRRKLGQLKAKLQTRQRMVASAKKDWTDLLRRIGLSESLKVPDALHTWQQIAEVQRSYEQWQWEDRDAIRDQKSIENFRDDVTRLARLIPGTTHRDSDSYATLEQWENRLAEIDDTRRERQRLLGEAKRRRQEAETFDSAIESARTRKFTLLSRIGAADREEIVARIKAMKKREELARLVDAARHDVEAASKSEPDLAIVEEDLIHFKPQENGRSITRAREELVELEASLQKAHEELGLLKKEIQQIEEDGSLEALSRKRKKVAIELKETTSRWAAAETTGQAIERVRRRVERHCQPRTLQLASDYLERLTLGRYHNVWAPLGERHLIVDDGEGKSFKVEHLSSGTREQLFLAVRMAMIRELSEQGIELPMVLDDVFVNFDQVRTEAAVDALLDFADQGQQVLFFTCHLHLAHMFESQGIDPIWLPGHSPRSTVMERVG